MHMWSASPQRILAAKGRIDPVFLDTPLRRAPDLDRRLGAELLFKDETANPIRSFKGRGACNMLAQMQASAPLVCASAGNFGQGMAWAARAHGVDLTVFAARNAVAGKVEAMRRLGASVMLEGDDFDAAKDAARAYAASEGLLFVEDGAHAPIAEGAGTLALEITEAAGPIDVFVTPLGNGALIAGVGCWAKHSRPETDVVAVCAAAAPAMALSVRNGAIVTTPNANTIADGIAVRKPILSAVHAVREVVDDIVLVEENHIREAMRLLQDILGLVVEPAGAAGLAALLATPDRWRGMRIAVPLCGGNV
jgi:threonine dehydratase